MTCSPFLLGGVINEHLKLWETRRPELEKEIRDGLYVDDLMTGGEMLNTVATKRTGAFEIFEDGTFKLHKWHFNVAALENEEGSNSTDEEDISYAKQQLGFSKLPIQSYSDCCGTKDALSVETLRKTTTTTKRAALSELAKVYDPLGLISPTTLVAKQLYREMRNIGTMGRGAARIDQETLGRMARRTFDKHYGATDSGPQFPPYYSGNTTWIRGREQNWCFSYSLCGCTARKQHNSRFGLLKISASEEKS